MFNKSKRNYKECRAEDTIEKIKDILKKLDLMPDETHHTNPYPQIYSMRVELKEEEGGFGTNGKGRTKEYSLASGYAEFLERIQNGLYARFSRTIANRLKKTYGFYYGPDEKCLSEKEFYELPKEILGDFIRYAGKNRANYVSSYFERLRVNNVPGVVSIPFYDTMNDKEIFLPLNLLLLTVGSNGMAAGNTYAEAIFQAVCEIMERWGAAEIFYKRLTPPSVPREFLKQYEEEFKIIQAIEQGGKYKVTIKDFSANKRIPSLGIIIKNCETNKYRLNVGAETSLQIALSRCLTEVYQGIMDEKSFDGMLLDIPQKEAECFLKGDENALSERYRIFCEFTKNGSGPFPPNLFGCKEDYSFDPSVFTSKDCYEKEVNALINYIHKMGYNVYIRDVGYLGFPSVLVYVPELSVLGRKNAPIRTKTDFFNIIEMDRIEPLFFNFESLSHNEHREIALTLERIHGNASVYEIFNVSLSKKSTLHQLDVSFFLTLIWYKLGEVKNAKRAFDKFLESHENHHSYYDVVGKYLDLKTQGHNERDSFEKILAEVSDKNLVEEVFKDLSNPDEIFKFVKLPRCPYCNECRLKEECLTTNTMKVAGKLYTEIKNNIINQKKLSWTIGK